jgi:hypothetical protein
MLYEAMEVQTLSSTSTPAFARAPHLRYPGAAAWLTQPAGLVVQITEPMRADLNVANWVVGPLYALLEKRFPAPIPLTLVLDLDLMTGRSFASRTVFLAKAREVGPRFARGFLIAPRSSQRSYLYAMHAGIALIQTLGVQVDIVASAAEAIAHCNMRAAR